MFHRPSRFDTPVSEAVKLVQRTRFGLLVSQLKGELQFSHLPFLVDIEGDQLVRLRGHFARNNPHWKALNEEADAVVVFNGPNAYVSAQWYKQSPAAPTWNYVAVHVLGKVRILPSEQDVNDIVNELIAVNEAELPKQWPVEQYSPARRAALLPHIIGFHLDVSEIEHKFKLSQHYADIDKKGAAAGLKSRGMAMASELADMILTTVSKEGDKPASDLTVHLVATSAKSQDK